MSLVPAITLNDRQGRDNDLYWQTGKAKDQAFKRHPKVLEMLSGELWTASCSPARALVRGLALREPGTRGRVPCTPGVSSGSSPAHVAWAVSDLSGSLVHHLKMRPSQECSEVTPQEFSEGKTSTQQGHRCQESRVDRCWELSFTKEICAQARVPRLPDPYNHPKDGGHP